MTARSVLSSKSSLWASVSVHRMWQFLMILLDYTPDLDMDQRLITQNFPPGKYKDTLLSMKFPPKKVKKCHHLVQRMASYFGYDAVNRTTVVTKVALLYLK